MRYITSKRCNDNAAQCTAAQCETYATVVVSNPFADRPATLICRQMTTTAAGGSQWKELVLQFPTAPVVTPPSSAILPFLSTTINTIILDRKVTDYPSDRFLAAINNILGITPREVQLESYTAVDSAAHTAAVFRCRSEISVQDADATCARILREASTAGSALNNELKTLSTTTASTLAREEDDSDHALYGLFALLAIPIICIVAACLFIKNRKRQADNQYMQDTATFSNVAAQPQPINNPYPYYDAPPQGALLDKPPPPLITGGNAYPAYGY
jgi:hypothetical protein